MQKQEKSNHYSIVNVSSIAGVKGMSVLFITLFLKHLEDKINMLLLLIGFKLNAPYAAVKHGVVGMTKSSALDVNHFIYLFIFFISFFK